MSKFKNKSTDKDNSETFINDYFEKIEQNATYAVRQMTDEELLRVRPCEDNCDLVKKIQQKVIDKEKKRRNFKSNL